MASLKSQQQLFGESISEPESLELDYDMWQGQFEIIGQTSSAGSPGGGGLNKSDKRVSDGDDSNLNLVFDRLDQTKSPILIDEETFLSLHPHDFLDLSLDNGGPDGPHSGIFIESLNGFVNTENGGSELGSKKNKRIDNFFNANLQKQKILFMNDKSVSDSLEREKPESEPEEELILEPNFRIGSRDNRRGSSNYDLNNNSSNSKNLYDNRMIIRDTLNDKVSHGFMGQTQ